MSRSDGGAPESVRQALREGGLEWEEPDPGTFVVGLPGERKLRTTVSLVLGAHSLTVNAFVLRHPEDDPAAVHRWLLERNARPRGVAYAIDHLGDVYVVGRLALAAVTPTEVDALLGAVHELADGAFDTLLSLGYADAIRREHAWRTARGESTANLRAFRHLTEPPLP